VTGSNEPIDLPYPPLGDDFIHLRPWALDDARALARAWKDPDIIDWCDVPTDADETVASTWIAGDARRRHARSSLDLVISPINGDAVMGEIGLSGFSADGRAAMLGYWAHLTYRRQGVTARAVTLLTDWAAPTLELDLIVARCHPANGASHAVMRKAKYTLEGHDSEGHKLFTYRRSRFLRPVHHEAP